MVQLLVRDSQYVVDRRWLPGEERAPYCCARRIERQAVEVSQNPGHVSHEAQTLFYDE